MTTNITVQSGTAPAGAVDGDPVAWLRAAYFQGAIETPGQEAFVRGFTATGSVP